MDDLLIDYTRDARETHSSLTTETSSLGERCMVILTTENRRVRRI